MKRLGMAVPKKAANSPIEKTSVENHADEISALIAKAKIAQSIGQTTDSQISSYQAPLLAPTPETPIVTHTPTVGSYRL